MVDQYEAFLESFKVLGENPATSTTLNGAVTPGAVAARILLQRNWTEHYDEAAPVIHSSVSASVDPLSLVSKIQKGCEESLKLDSTQLFRLLRITSRYQSALILQYISQPSFLYSDT